MGRHNQQSPRRKNAAAVGVAGVLLGGLVAFGFSASGATGGSGSGDQTCSFTLSGGSADGSVVHCTTATTPPPTSTTPPTETTPPPTKTTPPPSTTPPPTTSSAPPPVQTGFPDASNTGVPTGVTLKASGSITASTPNQVIEDLNITGHVDVRASGVVIKDCKIAAGGNTYGVEVDSGSVTVEDSTLTGSNGFAIGYDNWTALRVNVSGAGQDGFKGGDNTTLKDSYIHDFSPTAGAHGDGIQDESGAANQVIEHNTIDPSNGHEYDNSAVFIKNDLGRNSAGPISVTDNLLGGGNYTLYAVPGNGGTQSGISITDNHFLRDSQYGPTDIGYSIANWSGNVYDDTGSAIAK